MSNGVTVTDTFGQTINIDDLAGQTIRLEVPGRAEGVPEARAKVPRRVDLPDGEHYMMVLGGGSNLERVWFQAVNDRARKMRQEDEVPSAQVELWVMSQWATFIADRVIEHNFEYAPGDPLPVGLDLVWELGYTDSLALIGTLLESNRFFANPKKETPAEEPSSIT